MPRVRSLPGFQAASGRHRAAAALVQRIQRSDRIVVLEGNGEELPPDSDSALVNAGFATLTPLVGIRMAGDVPTDDVVRRLEQHLLQRSA